jgi:hypothetical protein
MNYSFPYTPYNVKFLNQDSLDPQALAYLTAAGITGATQQAAINNLVLGLKTDGTWSKMKAVYPFVTDNKNLLSFTETFNNPFWTNAPTFVSVSTNSAIAPNGTLTADSINETTDNSLHYVGILNSLPLSAAKYTLSVYAKKVNRDWIDLSLYDGTTARHAWFNINTGTIGTVESGVNATITDAGNGWYRCSIVMTMGATGNFLGLGVSNANGVSSYLGNGLTACYMWGAQLELDFSATSYQPILTSQQDYISSQFKYNLVNPLDSDAAFRLVFSGGWTHRSTGATPNGVNAFANTFLIPQTELNYASLGYYSRTNTVENGTGDANGIVLGVRSDNNSTVNNTFQLKIKTNPSNFNDFFYSRTGGPANNVGRVVDAEGRGFFVGTLDATNAKIYKNGVNVTTTAFSFPRSTPNLAVYLGSLNNKGVSSEYTLKESAFAHIGDTLTDVEVANLNNRVQAFQTALNRQV